MFVDTHGRQSSLQVDRGGGDSGKVGIRSLFVGGAGRFNVNSMHLLASILPDLNKMCAPFSEVSVLRMTQHEVDYFL